MGHLSDSLRYAPVTNLRLRDAVPQGRSSARHDGT
jgi:hypothetical protein